MNSSDEETDSDLAKNHVQLLIQQVTKLTRTALGADCPNDNDVEAALEAGKDILVIYSNLT